MDTRSRAAAFVVVTTLAVGALTERVADACSCRSPGPPCEAAWTRHAVFEGTVLSIAWDQTDPAPIWQARLVTFRLERAFIGPGQAGERVDVQTGAGGGDCGFTFEVGRRYLVYAGKNSLGRLVTSICSRTRAIEHATEDLSYLTNIPSMRAGAEVSGWVRIVDRGAYGELTETPIAGATVDLDGEGRRYSTKTDEHGDYRLDSVAPGAYHRTVRTPLALSFRDVESTIVVSDPRGCAADHVFAVFDRRAVGRVVDRSARPVRKRVVMLMRADASDASERAAHTTTDDEGRFSFPGVLAGRYRVLAADPLEPYGREPGIDARYCPGVSSAGVARVLTVGPDAGQFDIGDCRVPR